MDSVFGEIGTKAKAKSSAAALSKEELSKEELSKEELSKEELSKEELSKDALSLKVDPALLEEALNAAVKRRMIGVWSPTIAAAMYYLKGSIPRFSTSEVASRWIEEGLKRDYPELMRKLKEDMEH
ncbi:MAG: hypothetical protein A4E49_00039 [Methanosaeta sp. PtaU1.Bin112]|nr:MAG: hypothetical protein A4E49_00039 [Methanosaeta sp. PtaU1.Bin112]